MLSPRNRRILLTTPNYVIQAIHNGLLSWSDGAPPILDRDDPMTTARRFAMALAQAGVLVRHDGREWHYAQTQLKDPDKRNRYAPMRTEGLRREVWAFLDQCRERVGGKVVAFKVRAADVNEIIEALAVIAGPPPLARAGAYFVDDE